MRSQSYSNDTEIALSAHIIQTMLSFDISPTDLGVISLCKTGSTCAGTRTLIYFCSR
jgi:hypothetical protein